jgi:hypothetical protein
MTALEKLRNCIYGLDLRVELYANPEKTRVIVTTWRRGEVYTMKSDEDIEAAVVATLADIGGVL